MAGLRSLDLPSLEDIERRRLELWLVSTVLLVGLSGCLAVMTLVPAGLLPRWLSPAVLRAATMSLAVLFAAYSIDKEVRLRRLTRLLVDERMLTTALSTRLHEISTLLDAGRAVNSAYELEQVLTAILTGATELLPASGGSIMLLDADGELLVVASVGDGDAVGTRRPMTAGLVREAATRREPLLSGTGGTADRRGTRRVGDRMSVPMLQNGDLIGVLDVRASAGASFSEYDLRAVSLFAENASAAIAKARLYESSRRQAAELERLALHDPLTGLANRALLARHSDAALRAAAVSVGRDEAALLYIDLDGFKRVNDQLGHAAGDDLLTEVARRISGCLRDRDLAARLGGDEFAVLLQRLPEPGAALTIADRIAREIARPVALAAGAASVTASIGVCVLGRHGGDFETLLRRADMAQYVAKRSGKNSCRLYDAQLDDADEVNRTLAAQVLGALANEELLLRYQPVVDAATRRPVGLDAVLFWEHQARGLIRPADLLAGALDPDTSARVALWTVRVAGRTLERLRRSLGPAAPDWVSVRVRDDALRLPGFARMVAETLAEVGVAPPGLVLTVAEEALGRTPQVAATLADLRRTGVTAGVVCRTQAASLGALIDAPVDAVTVSGALVGDVTGPGPTRALVAAMLTMSRDLGLRTGAEGVQSDEQAQRLAQLGCALLQGDLFGAPADHDDIEMLFSAAPPAPRRPAVTTVPSPTPKVATP